MLVLVCGTREFLNHCGEKRTNRVRILNEWRDCHQSVERDFDSVPHKHKHKHKHKPSHLSPLMASSG